VAWVNQDLLVYSSNGNTGTTPLILAKTTMNAGRTWSCEDTDGGMTYFEVLSDNETVVTPAGTFTGCAMVKQTWEYYYCDQDYFWWKPGVGVVQSESYENCDWLNPVEHRELAAWHVTTAASDVTRRRHRASSTTDRTATATSCTRAGRAVMRNLLSRIIRLPSAPRPARAGYCLGPTGAATASRRAITRRACPAWWTAQPTTFW